MPDITSFLLFAQDAVDTTSLTGAGSRQMWITLGLLVLATVPTYFLGVLLARALRVPEYKGRIGFIFMAIGLAILLVSIGTPKFGIDLRGGVILVYEINEQATIRSNQGDPGGETDEDETVVDNDELVTAL